MTDKEWAVIITLVKIILNNLSVLRSIKMEDLRLLEEVIKQDEDARNAYKR